eukprot:scaffold90540_cov69-Phaeocystis_antarctica.AAC.3
MTLPRGSVRDDAAAAAAAGLSPPCVPSPPTGERAWDGAPREALRSGVKTWRSEWTAPRSMRLPIECAMMCSRATPAASRPSTKTTKSRCTAASLAELTPPTNVAPAW